MEIQIRPCSIATAVAVSQAVPELVAPYRAEEYKRRFQDTPHLILGAFDGHQAIGFKAGYERAGYFYSWMGGVLPAYRRKGIAKQLAQKQEHWAKAKAYESIIFKTRNVHKAMLCFALKNGFDIIKVEPWPKVPDNRIWLKKALYY
jgi:predicted GNAT superfamily acetyltransferase